ncbi:MarR family winged helix-turn-helix transcriptional regulator [Aneurinibacillus tyrosinisolvens]|uniref:MarR family winged helix-turn-helix transcriptional regulator n=1 Tax=Aneurinibacillus tyrosinisolvens TaxID=1443435 RepID=UPI00063F44B6|nr:MarR family transcriptional regulator [Aneurinibacillus tyrosinisolvens]
MKLDDSLGFVLNNAGRRVSQLLSLHFSPYGITLEQWTVLNRLAEQDGINQKELARRTGKDQTNVTRILDQLERKGLARRKPNAGDRRSFLAVVTEDGRKLNEILVPIEAEAIHTVMKDLSENEILQFRELLRKITENASLQIEELER